MKVGIKFENKFRTSISVEILLLEMIRDYPDYVRVPRQDPDCGCKVLNWSVCVPRQDLDCGSKVLNWSVCVPGLIYWVDISCYFYITFLLEKMAERDHSHNIILYTQCTLYSTLSTVCTAVHLQTWNFVSTRLCVACYCRVGRFCTFICRLFAVYLQVQYGEIQLFNNWSKSPYRPL